MNLSKFDFLQEHDLRLEFEDVGIPLQFSSGQTVVEPHKYIKVIPLVLKGSIKVLRETPARNELLLYHIRAGESCAVSISTSLMNKRSNIKAVAEDLVELVAIPASHATIWYDKYTSWRMFVLKTLNTRYDEIISTLDSVAFKRVDERLIDYLISKSKVLESNHLVITHQEIANELATSREVISRMLKQLEQRGQVKLFRNKVEILSLM